MKTTTKDTLLEELKAVCLTNSFKYKSSRGIADIINCYLEEQNIYSRILINKIPILVNRRHNSFATAKGCLLDKKFNLFLNSIGINFEYIQSNDILNSGFDSLLKVEILEKVFYIPIVRIVDETIYKDKLYIVLDIRCTTIKYIIKGEWKRDYLKSKTPNLVLHNLIDKCSIDLIDASFKDILINSQQ